MARINELLNQLEDAVNKRASLSGDQIAYFEVLVSELREMLPE